jgi:hypothetical protein
LVSALMREDSDRERQRERERARAKERASEREGERERGYLGPSMLGLRGTAAAASNAAVFSMQSNSGTLCELIRAVKWFTL